MARLSILDRTHHRIHQAAFYSVASSQRAMLLGLVWSTTHFNYHIEIYKRSFSPRNNIIIAVLIYGNKKNARNYIEEIYRLEL